MKTKLIFVAKLLILLGIIVPVAYQIHTQWGAITSHPVTLDWRFAPLALLGFGGVFLTSGLVWRWMAFRMHDRSPTLPLLGAYTFSQMGKYVLGKVVLLLMRLDRTNRVGMNPQVCVLSTLLENAMYMLSGGLVAALTLLFYVHDNPKLLVATVSLVGVLLVAFHPAIFYRLIDMGLRKLKYPPLPSSQRLPLSDLLLSLLLFLPCWACGGLALWASARCVAPALSFVHMGHFPGVFALSVIGGMASVLPGGLGFREGVSGLFLNPLIGFGPTLVAVALQRLFQIITEVTLGAWGAWASRTPKTPTLLPDSAATAEK